MSEPSREEVTAAIEAAKPFVSDRWSDISEATFIAVWTPVLYAALEAAAKVRERRERVLWANAKNSPTVQVHVDGLLSGLMDKNEELVIRPIGGEGEGT